MTRRLAPLLLAALLAAACGKYGPPVRSQPAPAAPPAGAEPADDEEQESTP